VKGVGDCGSGWVLGYIPDPCWFVRAPIRRCVEDTGVMRWLKGLWVVFVDLILCTLIAIAFWWVVSFVLSVSFEKEIIC